VCTVLLCLGHAFFPLLAGSTSATVEHRHIGSLGLWQMETCSDAHCGEMYAVWECTAATVVRQFDHELIINFFSFSHYHRQSTHHQWAAHSHSRALRVHHQTFIGWTWWDWI